MEQHDLHLWLPGELPKMQYFRTKKTQKMLIICQIDLREVEVAFELQICNAFAIARFLVFNEIH